MSKIMIVENPGRDQIFEFLERETQVRIYNFQRDEALGPHWGPLLVHSGSTLGLSVVHSTSDSRFRIKLVFVRSALKLERPF